MKLIRGGMKAPITTSWVSVADISGGDGVSGGDNVVESAVMGQTLSTLPDIVALAIEVQLSPVRTNATGGVSAWVRLEVYDPQDFAVASGDAQTDTFTGFVSRVASAAVVRRVVIEPGIIQSVGNIATVDALRVYVRTVGSLAGTTFTTSNIRSRLIYTPL